MGEDRPYGGLGYGLIGQSNAPRAQQPQRSHTAERDPSYDENVARELEKARRLGLMFNPNTCSVPTVSEVEKYVALLYEIGGLLTDNLAELRGRLTPILALDPPSCNMAPEEDAPPVAECSLAKDLWHALAVFKSANANLRDIVDTVRL